MSKTRQWMILGVAWLLMSSWSHAQIKLAELSGAPGTWTTSTALVFQSKGNVGYITNTGSGVLQKFRSTTGEVLSSLTLAPGIGPVTFSADQRTLYILGVTNQKIYVVDTATMTVRKEVSQSGSGFTARNNVLITADGARLMISDATKNQFLIFKTADWTLEKALTVGNGPTQAALLPNGRQVLVLCAGKAASDVDSLYIIDLGNLQVFDKYILDVAHVEPFNNLQMTPDGGTVFIPLYSDKRIAIFQLQSGILGSISCDQCDGPTKALISPDGKKMAVIASSSQEVLMYTLPDAASVTHIKIPGLNLTQDSTLIFSADSRSLYIPSSSSNEIILYSLDSSSVKKRVKVASQPISVFLNTETNFLASIDLGSNLVSLTALAPVPLYFPHLIQNATDFSGLALANFGSESASVSLTARDNDGVLLQGTTNPRLMSIPAGQQVSLVMSQIFGFNPANTLDGWVDVESVSAGISGLYLAGTIAQTQLDGFTSSFATGKLLGFSRITEQIAKFGGQTSTEIFLANPSEIATTVTFRLWGRSAVKEPGDLLAQTTRTISGLSRFRSRISSLMPNVVYPLESAYLEVISDVELSGVEIVRMGDSFAMIPAKIRGLPDKTFYAAQFASGGSGVLDTPIFTSVSLCNTSAVPVKITAQVTGDDGKIIPAGAVPYIRVLAPYETLSGTAEEVFNFPGSLTDPALYVGTLKIVADQEGLIGDVLYGDARDGKYLTPLSLQPQPQTRLGFCHFAVGVFGVPPKGLFTGIALYNPNIDNANITIDAFTPNGTPAGKSTQTLEGGRRISRTISQLIPSLTQQNGGSIRITSSLGILAFEVFGSSLSDFLAAVSPVVIP